MNPLRFKLNYNYEPTVEMWIKLVNHVAPLLYKYDKPYGFAACL